MIKTQTRLEDSSTKFSATFECTPQNVTYGGQTHIGGGTTKRLGIKEGVYLAGVRYKGEDGVWRSNGTNKTVTLKTSKNGVTLEVEATMQIWTMGLPSRDIPFLYFGNYSGVRKKYMHGYFSDSKPANPDNYKANYAKVPSDWTEVYRGWNQKDKGLDGNWAYKHAIIAGGETWNENCYEYRNGTNGSGQNGWTSEAGRKPQESRRTMYWIFEKKYKATVTSSGIIFNPNVPQISVEYAKSDSGYVTVKHTSPNKIGSYIKLCSWNTRTGTLSTIANFDVWLEHNASRKFEIDFVKHCGGEAGRGSDIKYYAWAKTSGGHLSNNQTNPNNIGASHWVGVHRFNGRPSIPAGLRVTGRDNIYYDNTTIHWNKSTDPDGDSITYDIWIKVVTPQGTTPIDKIVKTGQINIAYDFNISQYPEGSKITYKVRSNDGRIKSNWSKEITITKGEGALAADAIYPLKDSTVYNVKPRILIGTGSQSDSEKQTIKVKWNNTWYDNVNNSGYFSNKPGVSKTVVFKPPTAASLGKCTYSVKLNNVYADSPETIVTFNIAKTPYTINDIDPYIKINKEHLKALRIAINNVRKAYGLKATDFEDIKEIIRLNDYKTLANGLNDVNNAINNYDPNNKFDEDINLSTDMKFITDKEWDRIIEGLTIV